MRFGKYTPLRSRDKSVKLFVNGELACFEMVMGAYGQAYFAELEEEEEEEEEPGSGEQQRLITVARDGSRRPFLALRSCATLDAC